MNNYQEYKLQIPSNKEKGAIIQIFAVFMLAVIPLLAISVDLYFMTQGRLEEQNLAEYAALTALDGYVKTTEENTLVPSHDLSRSTSLNYLKSIEGKNGVTGLTEGTSWNFTPTSCSGSICSGTGWFLEYGSWDGDIFSPAVPELVGDPESIDPALVNAVKVYMEIPNNGFVNFFRQFTGGDSEGGGEKNPEDPEGGGGGGEGGGNQNIKLPVSALGYLDITSGLKTFRLARIKAKGTDDS